MPGSGLVMDNGVHGQGAPALERMGPQRKNPLTPEKSNDFARALVKLFESEKLWNHFLESRIQKTRHCSSRTWQKKSYRGCSTLFIKTVRAHVRDNGSHTTP